MLLFSTVSNELIPFLSLRFLLKAIIRWYTTRNSLERSGQIGRHCDAALERGHVIVRDERWDSFGLAMSRWAHAVAEGQGEDLATRELVCRQGVLKVS